MIEAQFLAFFIALLVAVLFSSLFSRFNIPWAVTLILGGIIAGPSMFNWIQLNDTILFLAEIGAVFLMFMAGLETPMKSLRHSAKSVGSMAIFNGAVPFVVGFLIGMVFKLDTKMGNYKGKFSSGISIHYFDFDWNCRSVLCFRIASYYCGILYRICFVRIFGSQQDQESFAHSRVRNLHSNFLRLGGYKY
jgi:hypothetical protein